MPTTIPTVVRRLRAIKPTPVAPDWVLAIAADPASPLGSDEEIEIFLATQVKEIKAVNALVGALRQLPPAIPNTPVDLL